MPDHAKPPLTRERIVAVAVQVADRDGIAALSMRGLAEVLDAGTMSLYNHVRNKDELLDVMVEHVAAEIDPPPRDGEWKAGARELAVSMRRVLRRHPWAVDEWSTRVPGPRRWALMEAMLELLSSAGLREDATDLAFHAILNHVLGHTREELAQAPTNPAPDLEGLIDGLDAERFPLVRAHLRYHTVDHPEHDSFLFVLELILHALDGLTP